ncbi:2-hydroxychromene-2-carboxylate isomerase [Burkholderiales bacterium]|nr:MAG: 2-hydroxychromene-2-carboxylate isomerase [Burkholderiales bacterium]CAG1000584.1 2-hydroxychromene-2-carboxylate isomerase [Burkholderiales bacterium]
MAKPIEFFFDFSSPYAYLAAMRIEDLVRPYGREVAWRPVLLGVIFKAVGGAPLTEYGLKGPYSVHDFARSARFCGLPYHMPEPFPIATQNAARLVLGVAHDLPQYTGDVVRAIFAAFFVHNRNINDPAVLGEICQGLGLDAAKHLKSIEEAALKEALRANCDEALSRGVFGAPFMFVDDEPFWGNDRLPQVEHWLKTGGF